MPFQYFLHYVYFQRQKDSDNFFKELKGKLNWAFL